MVADSVLLIEQFAVNAWPAATAQLADGWLLRHTPAVARRRSNSALPPASAAQAGPSRRARALDLAERFYARRDQATVVQVSPAELHDQLDRELAERGYRRQAPTVVVTASIDRLLTHRPVPPAPTLAVSVATTLLGGGARWAADHGARHLYLQVEQDNLPALRLYRRLGFQPSHHYHYRVATPLRVRSGGRPGAVPPASRGS